MDEELTNELIAVIWPALDNGATKSDIQAAVNNVLDSWEPEPKEGLIAAAPELLEACVQAAKCLYPDDAATSKAIKLLQAAIRKATTQPGQTGQGERI
jgi:hypothetical protein